jgi:hypothetical protein
MEIVISLIQGMSVIFLMIALIFEKRLSTALRDTLQEMINHFEDMRGHSETSRDGWKEANEHLGHLIDAVTTTAPNAADIIGQYYDLRDEALRDKAKEADDPN